MEEKNYYTVWSWHDAPYNIRLAGPWEKGTWIVRVEPGYGFPHEALAISEHPDWEVHQQQIDGRWYTFISDPQNIPWPEFDPVQFDFSGYGMTSRLNFPPDY